jgi:CRISPR-associated protein Cmr3
MTTTTIELTCRDPIVSRDGRPFGREQGNRMRSLPWPMPSVVAGSLRTALGKAAGKVFCDATSKTLLQVAVGNVFPTGDGQLYLPAPEDCVVHEDGRVLCVRPEPVIEDAGCDWPEDSLLPVMLPLDPEEEDFKPKDGPAWWPRDQLAKWLVGGEKEVNFDHTFLEAPEIEERTHVQLNPDTGTGQEGMLFTTAALPLTHLPRYGKLAKTAPWSERFATIRLATRVAADGWAGESLPELDMLHPLGGERRLVHWKATRDDPWKCPGAVHEALMESRQVRMVLATPAIFAGGWKPGWLKEGLTGSPFEGGPRLRLVGFTIKRWRAVSGWSLAQPPGPKKVKRIVPAGGVYFFEVEGDASAAGLADQWLRPVSDDEQDQRDGFGLAVWGTW